MYRGIIKFKCDDCGGTFIGPDIEWCCMAFSEPMRCPHCGSRHTWPGDELEKEVYQRIWEDRDRSRDMKEGGER